MRKAPKARAASRIFALRVEPRIQWKLKKSYNDLKQKPHSWFPRLSYSLLPYPFPWSLD